MNSAAADFENEMLAFNPEYDLIFSQYNEACSRETPTSLECRRRCSPNKMKIITKMNEIIGHKPIGELPTHSDWDEDDSVEKETIALMRKFGLEQSCDRRPDEKRTISTIPTTDDVIIMRNGHKKMSIFMSDSFFELKPRSEPSFFLDDELVSHAESTTSTSEETSADAVDTLSSNLFPSSSSAFSDEITPASTMEYEYVSSNSTSSPSTTQSDLSWRRMSGESSESTTEWNCNVKYSNKLRGNKNRKALTEGNSNWRLAQKSSEELKTKEAEKQMRSIEGVKEKPNVVQFRESEKNVKIEEKNVAKITPNVFSNCGSQLYKPKDLFLKKKVTRIQEVLAANQ